jgi:hypothetical protein
MGDKKQPASLRPPQASAASVPLWTAVNPATGTVAPGNSQQVDVGVSANNLAGGNYYATLLFSNNDPLHPTVSIPVHLHVIGVPDISLTPSTYIYFGNVTVGQSHSEILAVSNVGSDDLIISAIASSHTDFTPAVTSFTLTPGTTRNVSISYHPAASGPSFAMLSVSSNDPDEGVLTVPLWAGYGPPAIAKSDVIPRSSAAGAKATHTVTIANNGAGPPCSSTFREGTSQPTPRRCRRRDGDASGSRRARRAGPVRIPLA